MLIIEILGLPDSPGVRAELSKNKIRSRQEPKILFTKSDLDATDSALVKVYAGKQNHRYIKHHDIAHNLRILTGM